MRDAGLAAGGDTGRQDEWDRLHYGHPRMPMSERAKIFMPFDPLKGFRAELRRRERAVEDRMTAEPWLPEDDPPPADPDPE